jgi:hypothetical protein
MNLRYISLGLDYDFYIKEDNKLRYEFHLHTRFISNYFSKAIRKYNYKTDGTFNMISIALLPQERIEITNIKAIDVLKTYLPFNQKRYEQEKGTETCNYYLEVLEEGLRKASEHKKIPLEMLLGLITDFKLGGCKNEWIHKKKRFKEEDLEVILFCEFTTNYFQLRVKINQLSAKKELVNGIVIKTEPDEVLFEKMYKDVIIEKNIIIKDNSDSPRVIINKLKTFDGNLEFEIKGDKEIKNILTYKM